MSCLDFILCYYITEVMNVVSINQDIFIKRLKHAMERKGFNGAELARACQQFAEPKGITITRKHISAWLTGRWLPKDYETLEILADALNVPTAYFFGFDAFEGISADEINLINAWRACSDYDRQTIRIILRQYLPENTL